MSVDGWEPVIGLEVHCQLRTESKMFSGCRSGFRAEPNTLIDPYTFGLPGTLPVPNERAVRYAVALALATECEIHRHSRFARKHYFYPDLSKGYQITQSDHPYATGGCIRVPDGEAELVVRLIRIHLEEDAGKNVHVVGEDISLVDYNRAGAPLVEIVSEPDLRSAQQASAYMKELRALVRHLGISDANMEEGTLRCDANVSLRRRGEQSLGTRCEIKNLNSFRFLELAIEAEIRRQADILEGGGSVRQSTLAFDSERVVTRVMRSKEEAADYRYFPDPDLPPLVIPDSWIEEIARTLPELPRKRRDRYRQLGLSPGEVELLASDPELSDYFDRAVASGASAKKAYNWIGVELLGRLHADGRKLAEVSITPLMIAELVGLIETGTITGRNAKEVFSRSYAGEGTPAAIVERAGFRQVSDIASLESIVMEVIRDSPKQVHQYQSGRIQLKGWFVGQVIKRTGGQANPAVVTSLVEKCLAAVED